jgi:DnaJ-class molecular chaperone
LINKTDKRNLMVNEVAEAVAQVLKHPKYSALAIGLETKQAVLTQVELQLDDKIKEGKEKAVDRILDSVRRNLNEAPEFTFNHCKDTGTITFTYTQKQEGEYRLCSNCNGKGTLERRYYTTTEKYNCPNCDGAGRLKEEWEF